MTDNPKGIRSPDAGPRPRRRLAGFVFLATLCGLGVAGYLMWLKLEQASVAAAGPVMVVTVAAGAVAALAIQLRSMSVSEILEVVWEGVHLLFEAIAAVFRGIWHWFLGLFGLD